MSLVLTLQGAGDMAAAAQQPELDKGTFSESFDLSELREVGDEKETERDSAVKEDGVKRGHVNRK